jgi:hypothetical protein
VEEEGIKNTEENKRRRRNKGRTQFPGRMVGWEEQTKCVKRSAPLNMGNPLTFVLAR